MTSKTLIAFLVGLTTGGILGLLFAPIKGSALHTMLTKRYGNEDEDEGGIHNFNIAELTSENSASLAEIRKHFQD